MESYFIMYRLTNEVKYRDWGWQIFEAIRKLYNSGSQASEIPYFDGTLPGGYFLTETLKVKRMKQFVY